MATTGVLLACSICNEPLARAEKRLYGYNVCDRCYSDFATKRAFAYLVDMLLWTVVSIPLGFLIFVFSGISGVIVAGVTKSDNQATGAFMFVFVLGILASIVIVLSRDGFKGHSPAKAMFGLQVIDDRTGRPINFWDSIQRNLPLSIPLMPLYVAYQIFQQDGRRMGDGWARTKVIWKAHRDRPPFFSRQEIQAQLAAKAAGTKSP